MRLIRTLSLILLIFFVSELSGQFNVQIGYGLAYSPATEVNGLVTAFNEFHTNEGRLTEAMPDLHFLNGIMIGARWQYEFMGIEVLWENLGRRREAIGEEPGTGALFTQEYIYSLNNYSAGIESYFGVFGLGASFGMRQANVKRPIAASDFKKEIVKDRQYFTKAYLIVNLGGSPYVRLAVKPYISIPLNSLDISPLASEMNLTETPGKENFWLYGVSFVFYNGIFRD